MQASVLNKKGVITDINWSSICHLHHHHPLYQAVPLPSFNPEAENTLFHLSKLHSIQES